LSSAAILFTGLISAGGKPFPAHACNDAIGHLPKRAYAFATLGVAAAALAALAAQFAFVAVSLGSD
jgi:hypothetical protein